MTEGLNWDDLRYLEALVRQKKAPAVARELGVSTSTVYRRIGALEEALGAGCLVRGGTAIELTRCGEAIVALARDLHVGLARAMDVADAERQVISGRVSLTTVDGFLPLLVGPLGRLAERHPDLRIDLHLGYSGPSVRRREVDVAIGVMENPPPGLVGRRLLRIDYAVFGTPDAASRRPLRWVVTGPPIQHEPEARWESAHAGAVALATGSRTAMMRFVLDGLGVALLPRPQAQRYPELVEVEELSAKARELRRDAWLLVHPDMRHDARVRALADALSELAASPMEMRGEGSRADG